MVAIHFNESGVVRFDKSFKKKNLIFTFDERSKAKIYAIQHCTGHSLRLPLLDGLNSSFRLSNRPINCMIKHVNQHCNRRKNYPDRCL